MSGTNKEWGVTPGSYPFLVAHVFSFLSHFHLTSVVHVNLSWRDYCQTNQQSFFQNFSITFRWGCRTMAKFADDLFEVQLWCQDGTGDTLAISCSMNKNKICVWAILRPKKGSYWIIFEKHREWNQRGTSGIPWCSGWRRCQAQYQLGPGWESFRRREETPGPRQGGIGDLDFSVLGFFKCQFCPMNRLWSCNQFSL